MSKPDVNLYSIANEQDFSRTLSELVADPAVHADALKLSNCRVGIVNADRIVGGREDCIDINRGFDLTVAVGKLEPKGRFAVTIKGGADLITISAELYGHGKETDIDIGNWSDQSMARTKRVCLSIRTHDGSPVRVRVLHGWRPLILNPTEQTYEIDDSKKGWFGFVFGLWKRIERIFRAK